MESFNNFEDAFTDLESIDSIGSHQENNRRLAIIEESINRTLLTDDTKKRNCYLTPFLICIGCIVLGVSILVLIAVIIIIMVKNI